MNLARSLGPALGGVVVALAGPAAVFGLNALTFLGVIAALARLRPHKAVASAPAERWLGAMGAGLRYVRHTRALRAVLFRCAASMLPASVLAALLPLYARGAAPPVVRRVRPSPRLHGTRGAPRRVAAPGDPSEGVARPTADAGGAHVRRRARRPLCRERARPRGPRDGRGRHRLDDDALRPERRSPARDRVVGSRAGALGLPARLPGRARARQLPLGRGRDAPGRSARSAAWPRARSSRASWPASAIRSRSSKKT